MRWRVQHLTEGLYRVQYRRWFWGWVTVQEQHGSQVGMYSMPRLFRTWNDAVDYIYAVDKEMRKAVKEKPLRWLTVREFDLRR